MLVEAGQRARLQACLRAWVPALLALKRDHKAVLRWAVDVDPLAIERRSVLASAVDGAVLLIQHRRNPQSMVLRAQQIMAGLKTPLLGVVLTQVPLNAGGDYGYYTHNYSYYAEGGAKRGKTTKGGQKPPKPAEPERLVLREPTDQG